LKPGWANSLRDPISKKLITKRTGRVFQGVGPELKPQYRKQTNNNTWHWWLIPIILATWEVEIKKIEVPGQPGQIV
jgi:hypothetical protein